MKLRQYSGVICKTTLAQLTNKITQQLHSWSEQWLPDALIRVEVSFQNKTLFSNKSLINSDDAFWANSLACCQFHNGSSEELVKLALKLAPSVQLNEVDQQLVNFVAHGMSMTLDTSIMELLTVDNHKSSPEPLQEKREEQKQYKNICLSFDVFINHLTLSLSFTDEFLFLYQNLNTAKEKSTLKTIKMSKILAKETMTFDVALPLPKISFEQLLQLKKGQVIKLEQSLDQPLAIKHGSNTAPFKGFLIKKGVQKAVYLSGK